MTSLLTTIVKAHYPWSEQKHNVHLWSPNGHKLTNSVGGLCFVLSGDRDLNGYRMRADGVEYTGDEIRAWGEEHLPESLTLARDIRRHDRLQETRVMAESGIDDLDVQERSGLVGIWFTPAGVGQQPVVSLEFVGAQKRYVRIWLDKLDSADWGWALNDKALCVWRDASTGDETP